MSSSNQKSPSIDINTFDVELTEAEISIRRLSEIKGAGSTRKSSGSTSSLKSFEGKQDNTSSVSVTKKHVFLFGTRPEAIKMAPLILTAEKVFPGRTISIFTGQHRDMVRPILDFFGITPTISLDIMGNGASLNIQASRLLKELDQLFESDLLSSSGAPHSKNSDFSEIILYVQGDTLSATIAALAGFHRKVKVAHVEAGLRTGDLSSPWPEEFNRRMISLTAQWHFCPTQESVNALRLEGVPSQNIFQVGNTGIDALFAAKDILDSKPFTSAFRNSFFLASMGDKPLILVTLHRRENFGSPLNQIFELLKKQSQLADRNILLPLHRNPSVRDAAKFILGVDLTKPLPQKINQSLWVCDPLDYDDFLAAMIKSRFILTDSGGVQEESPCLGKPVLVARESTERPEVINCGSGELVGSNVNLIESRFEELLIDSPRFRKMSQKRFPFGDGLASLRILKTTEGIQAAFESTPATDLLAAEL